MRLLESNRAVVLVGLRGVGKSTLAKYVAYSMLMQEQADYVVVPEGPINVNELYSNAGVGDFLLLRLRGCPTGRETS
jgi:shikimate kinase